MLSLVPPQALRADVQRVSLLCCVFADQPADPITQMLGDLPSELASLAHRTYVSPAAYMKRLLLLQAIATDAHDMVSASSHYLLHGLRLHGLLGCSGDV